MVSFNQSLIEREYTKRDAYIECPGLIGQKDFARHELHGFEVDLDGNVMIPQFTLGADVILDPDQQRIQMESFRAVRVFRGLSPKEVDAWIEH